MRILAELDMMLVLTLAGCGGGAERGAFQDRLFQFANAAADRAPWVEASRVHSPTFCQGLVRPASFSGPFRRGEDYARMRDLCIRH